MSERKRDQVVAVPNGGWDARLIVCRCGPIVDGYVLVSERFVVLVDTMINPQTATQMLDIAREHLTGSRRLLVVNTHADYDHCWGNQIFAGRNPPHPAPVIATMECAAQFDSPAAGPYLQEMQTKEPDRYADVEYAPPSVRFSERLMLSGGDLTIELFETPGHAPGHLSIWIAEISTLLAGDAAEAPFPFARTAGQLPALRRSLARLAALQPATVLYSHTPAITSASLLHDNIAYFDRLERRCRAARQRGVNSANLGDDPAATIAFPFDEALPRGVAAHGLHSYFREQGHPMQIAMMVRWLELEDGGG